MARRSAAALRRLRLLGTIVPRPLLAACQATAGEPGASCCSATRSTPTSPFRSTPAMLASSTCCARQASRSTFPASADLVRLGRPRLLLETPTWSQLKPGPVFKALTLDASVMHVELARRNRRGASGRLELRQLEKPSSSGCSTSSKRASPGGGRHSTSPARLGDTTHSSRPTAISTRCSVATPGRRPRCVKPGCRPAGGTRCRRRWPCRWTCTIEGGAHGLVPGTVSLFRREGRGSLPVRASGKVSCPPAPS